MRSAIRHSQIAVLCTTALVAACAKGDTSVDSTKAADSATAGVAATSAAPATGASEAGWTDPNILAFLDDANVADSAAGSVAATKATSVDVKSFGKQMVRDHHAMRKEGQDVAKKLNVTPQPKAGDMMAAESAAFRDSLSSMSAGPAWDRTYIDHEVAGHEKVLTTAQSAAGATQNPDIKALITKSAPKVQAHLDKAKAIQTKLGGAK
jgi:putative membrane protein